MRRPAMAAATAGAIGVVGAAVAARRGADGTNGDGPAAGTLAVTVSAPADEVRRVWEQRQEELGLPATVEIAPAPADRGTEVRLRLDADASDPGAGQDDRPDDRPPRERLRAFKSMVECGEVLTTEGQPSGRSEGQEARTRALTDRLRAWSPA